MSRERAIYWHKFYLAITAGCKARIKDTPATTVDICSYKEGGYIVVSGG